MIPKGTKLANLGTESVTQSIEKTWQEKCLLNEKQIADFKAKNKPIKYPDVYVIIETGKPITNEMLTRIHEINQPINVANLQFGKLR